MEERYERSASVAFDMQDGVTVTISGLRFTWRPSDIPIDTQAILVAIQWARLNLDYDFEEDGQSLVL